MSDKLVQISLGQLGLSLLPLFGIIFLLAYAGANWKKTLYASIRMGLQLIAIGLVLKFIFESESHTILTLILAFMLLVSGWIATNPIRENRFKHFQVTILALATGCLPTLAYLLFIVLKLEELRPNYIIPLAGMVFANAMNAVSIGSERYQSRSEDDPESIIVALQAALIPLTNSFFAVGLVSLPGLMTGQILAGIDPFMAVRYQIIIMSMVYCASTVSTLMYLRFLEKLT